MDKKVALYSAVLLTFTQSQVRAEEPSVERGLYVSIIGSCHDCHTRGYRESGGKIDPALALKGGSFGFQGPWGTSYPANLRLTARNLNANGFVAMLNTIDAAPPMPWYNVRKLSEADKRSLYLYIGSLGEAGDPVPNFVPPGSRVNTPYVVLAPPLPPPACSRDLDCGLGQICDPAGSGQCIARTKQ
jgi:hypothetical protein